MLRCASALIATALLLSPASAQGNGLDSAGARYSFARVENGYLRLDQRSGQVSLCTRREAGWACHPVPDERSALEEEIARLQRDNAALKRELLARGGTLPGAAKPEPPPAVPSPERGSKPPDPADLDRAMALAEKLWRRLVEMIARLQRDIFTQI